MTEQRALQQVVVEALNRMLEFAFDDDGTPYHPYIPHMAADVINALRDHRTVTTTEQLDALPEGSVVRAGDSWRGPGAWTKGRANGGEVWFHWALEYGEPAGEIPLPALVLWNPEEDDQ